MGWRLRRLVATTACFMALSPAAPALGSGFAVARFAGEHGHPTTYNPTALYFNPAALRVRRPELFVDGLLGYRRMTYTRKKQPTDAADVPGAEGANEGRATLRNWLVSPSLWFALPASDNLTLAVGVFIPFGGPVSWDRRDDLAFPSHPGPIDGVARFHAIEGLSVTSYGSLGASYALSKSLRVGAAFNLIYSRVEDVRAWSAGSNGVSGEGRSLLEVDGLAAGFGAGVFYEAPSQRLRAGLSYQSRPNVSGGLRLGGRLVNDIGGPSSAEVHLHEDLPDVFRGGVAYQPERTVELRASLAFERWSAFERQCITQADAKCQIEADGSQPDGGEVLQNVPRAFDDALEARVGMSVWTSDALELFSGIGVMSQAVPDETLEPSLPDFVGVTFALGAKVQVSRGLSVAGSLSHLVSPARDVAGKSAGFAPPSQAPSPSGHYAQSVSYADVFVSVRF
jgi:long-chain fatty acid transport protein